MDSAYLQDKLHKLMLLIAPEDCKKTVFSLDANDNKFVFGYEKDGVRQINRVTKQVAILIAMDVNYLMNHKQEPKRTRTKRVRTR